VLLIQVTDTGVPIGQFRPFLLLRVSGEYSRCPDTTVCMFDTRIAVIVSDDLQMWQKLNVTAFTMSGIAGIPDVLGEEYVDGSGRTYLPMIRQPVLVFSATPSAIRAAYDLAIEAGVAMAIFTRELFDTPHDEANRAAVRAVPSNELRLAGLAARGPKKLIDRMTKGLSLHA
jgi:hypothetical protein